MINFPHIKDLCRPTPSKIIMLVVDGLGGMPHPDTGRSELGTARLPNLDALARQSACGLTIPVSPGITPGSGPGHLALFGYDPVQYLVGRGVLEALGIGVELAVGDVAARGNFCTVDADGRLVDRRAGRIPTDQSAALVGLLARVQVPGVKLAVYPVQEHRFALVLRGEGLGDHVRGTDPQAMGVIPPEARALADDSLTTARAVNAFVDAARQLLAEQDTANMVLLRGFSRPPHLPDFGSTYCLKPAAIAAYPMYRGLAKLAGMKVLNTGQTFGEELDTLEQHLADHDFFFLHYKPADTAGEDGDFDAKVARLEELDAQMPRILGLKPDTLVIAGDHSTPAVLAGHSWHQVPLLVHSPWTAGDGVKEFSERECRAGPLGVIPATSVMTIALAHAGKLSRYGP